MSFVQFLVVWVVLRFIGFMLLISGAPLAALLVCFVAFPFLLCAILYYPFMFCRAVIRLGETI